MARYYIVRGSYLQRLKTMIGNRITSEEKILPEREEKNTYPLSFLPYNPMQYILQLPNKKEGGGPS